MKHCEFAALALINWLTLPLLAQIPHTISTGSLTGHILCADTQRPARFAEVYIIPRVNTSSLDEKVAIGKLYMVNVNTALDGSYSTTLPPGEYYVVPRMDGYVVDLQPDPDVIKPRDTPNFTHVFAKYPLIKVIADHSVNADVTMTRGAVISGRVLFEDGSPVVHQRVLIHVTGSQDPFSLLLDPVIQQLGDGQHTADTDDVGRYRFSGLAPGKYELSVTVEAEKDERAGANESGAFFPTGSRGAYLTVYAPSAWREADAKPVEVRGAESRLEEDIQIDTTELHGIHGRILSAVDHHPVSGGIVRVFDTSTPPNFLTVTHLQPDGTYSLPNIPSGSYVLTILHVADVIHGADAADALDVTVVKSYSDGKIPVIVADKDVVNEDLELTEKPAVEKR